MMLKDPITRDEIDLLSQDEIEERWKRYELDIGDIVERPDPQPSGRHDRGVVTWARGHGNSSGGFGLSRRDHIIRYSAGCYSVTDNFEGQWVKVPSEAWTARERVLRASMLWRRPDWLEDGEYPEELDSYEFALLDALAWPHSYDDDDWEVPTLEDLAVRVADLLDREAKQDVENAITWARTMEEEKFERKLLERTQQVQREADRRVRLREEAFEQRVAEALETWRIQQSLKDLTVEQKLGLKLYGS